MEIGKPVSVLFAAVLVVATTRVGAEDLGPAAAPASDSGGSASKSIEAGARAWECPSVVLIDSDAGLAVFKGEGGLTVSSAGETVADLGVRVDEILHDRVLVSPTPGSDHSWQYWLHVSHTEESVPCAKTARTFATPVRVEVESTIVVLPDGDKTGEPSGRIVTLPSPDELVPPDTEEGGDR